MVRYWTTLASADQWKNWPKYNVASQNVLRLMLPRSEVLATGRFARDHHCQFWDETGIY